MKLAVILAFLFFGIDAKIPGTDPCDNLKVTTEIKHTTDGLDNGSVEVKVEGTQSIVHYFFHNEKGYPLSMETSLSSIDKLPKGKMSYTVITEDGCKKKTNLIIE